MEEEAIGGVENTQEIPQHTPNTTQQPEHKVTLDWIIPDGLNSRLEEIEAKNHCRLPSTGDKPWGDDRTDTKHRTFL